ncbi:hypothetical protein OROHE_006334 [Orobanche hederae]
MNKKIREKEENVDILLASEATMAQGWIVDSGDEDDLDLTSEFGDDCGIERRRSCRIQEIRELHEDDNVSDEEEDDGWIMNLNPIPMKY